MVKMKLKKKNNILIIGSGVLGAYLAKELKNNRNNIIITTRKLRKNYYNFKKLNLHSKVKFVKLNILNKEQIKKIIKKFKPTSIYYFAGQSSLVKSLYNAKNTIESNFTGAKNFLNIIKEEKLKTKFFKANSGYIFKSNKKKINLRCKFVNTKNPYIKAQIKAFKLVKMYRENLKINCYNIVFFNIESPLRNNNFFFMKACLAAKNKKKIGIGNLEVIRDFSWAPEIMRGLMHANKIDPCDLIFGSGKGISTRELIKKIFAHEGLDYKKFIKIDNNFFRKEDKKIMISDIEQTIKKLKKFSWKPKTYKNRLIKKMLNSL